MNVSGEILDPGAQRHHVWGLNEHGQFGDGTTNNSSTGCWFRDFPTCSFFAMGECHTVALKTDGTLRSWGRNDSGQLGDGTLVNRLRPVQVTMKDGTSLSNVTMLCAGYGHTKVLRFETVVPSNHVHGLAFADLSPEARQPVPEDDNVRGIASCSP
jgi:alpha-tubulin suppressor-like RCC1 family protein